MWNRECLPRGVRGEEKSVWSLNIWARGLVMLQKGTLQLNILW